MVRHSFLTLTVCLTALFGAAGIGWGGILVNGDFEDTAGWGDLGTGDVPPGWGGTNCAVMQTGENAIGGTGTSALMVAGTGKITQSFDETSPQWRAELDFATEDPGDASARSLTSSIFNSGNALITFRVNGDGDFQVYERGGAGWHTPTGLAGVVIFDDAVETTPLVHHLAMVGHFDLVTPTYDVMVTDSNGAVFEALGLTSWNKPIVDGIGAGPQTGQGIDMIDPGTTASSADYVIDNISIVPEPVCPVLFVGVLVGFLLRRWRN